MAKHEIKIPDNLVPEGYKAEGFYGPRKGETFRGISGFVSLALCDIDEPFLILKKVSYRFEPTGKFRKTRKNDWIKKDNGGFLQWPFYSKGIIKREIYRRIEVVE